MTDPQEKSKESVLSDKEHVDEYSEKMKHMGEVSAQSQKTKEDKPSSSQS